MTEKEYIEREALIKVCKKIIHDRWNETTAPVSWSHAYADFIDDIKEQPAVDVVPIVRCKDCKHKFTEYDGSFTCNVFSNSYGLPYRINPNDFCSYGERKENDNG